MSLREGLIQLHWQMSLRNTSGAELTQIRFKGFLSADRRLSQFVAKNGNVSGKDALPIRPTLPT